MLKDLCFEIIQTCPNKCKFCSSNASIEKQKIIEIDQFKKTVTYFMNQGGIEELSISGGEPFMHPDLFEMIRFCKEKGVRTVLFTSGIKRVNLPTKEEIEEVKQKCTQILAEIEEKEPWNERLKNNVKAYYENCLNPKPFVGLSIQECEKLKQLGLDKIVFDWQAFEETTDNELMGRKGLSTCLMNSVLRAKRVGLDIDIHFIPMKPNYKQFTDIIECLEIAGINNISILNFIPQGRGRENREILMLSDEELREFSIILDNARKQFSGNIRIGIPLNGNISHLCTAGTEKLDIKYDGTILPCPAFKEISAKTMAKYGIKLHSIYEDLEQVVMYGGKRQLPLCKQVYGFKGNLTDKDESR